MAGGYEEDVCRHRWHLIAYWFMNGVVVLLKTTIFIEHNSVQYVESGTRSY